MSVNTKARSLSAIIASIIMTERQHRSTGRSSDTIASFLLKTYEILEHPENKKIICWDKDDIGFVVIDVISFTRQILPKYFRHSNFSSFVRQLNMYDFHKVKQDNEMLVFKNPQFCRGEQQKLRFIKRKAAKKITGHKRFYNQQKPQHEKTTTAYKWLKKSLEGEINHSCNFFEKSIETLSENNSTIFDKSTKMQNIKSHDFSLDSVDTLYLLREDCDQHITKTVKWLDDYLDILNKKLKIINNYNLQLQQSKREEEQERHIAEMKSVPEL